MSVDQKAAAPGAVRPHVRLGQLDGLRGFAAIVIMLYHADMVFRTHTPFVRGYLLVDLFFLLSGFVLAVSTEAKLNAGIGALEFTQARFVRLWPLVAVGAGVAATRSLIRGYDPQALVVMLALDLAMIPSLAGRGPFYRLNGPQWTLFYELLANFLHALVLRRVATRWLPLIAAIFGVGLVYTVRRHGSDTLGVNAPNWHNWWMALPRVGWSYVLGVWLGRLYKAGLRTPALPWWLALALPVGGVMLVPSLPWRMATGDLLFVIPFLPLAMWGVAQCRPPQSALPALEWLGTFSLPLYCVHLTVLVAMSELFGRGAPIKYAAILAALALSYLFFRLVSFGSKPTVVKPKTA
ncbi:acyltransferase family protein [Novosphingobium piscinae]|uniref:Acyltransferase n=1 Tax=Novosphingobium piscinae TaxID=1507448 RepID=A0A7X1G2E1_9SPHN|nr:acyltransferase [Novosphingobium piscinae]MBC2670657.1 acyltransferase [Novosphingobium piscinae]